MTSAVGRAQPLVKGNPPPPLAPLALYFTARLRLADSSGSSSCLAGDACEPLRAMDHARGLCWLVPIEPFMLDNPSKRI